MKHFTQLLTGFAILLVSTLTSCSNSTQDTTSDECQQLMDAQEEQAANLDMYEATWDKIINQRQLDQINADNFTEDITLVTVPENIVGIDGFRDYYNNYLTGFSDITFTIKDAFGQGDKIVKHWNFKGIHSGEFFGIPATGRIVDIEGVTLVTMRDGRIAQEQDFLDNLDFLSQLGLMGNEPQE